MAHGSPADPDAQEEALRAFAARVGACLPGWTLRGATLARPGAVEEARAGLEAPLIYPFFVAPGWFVDSCLPARLGAGTGARLAPLGVDPDLPGLVAGAIEAALAAQRLSVAQTGLVIAAHGSPKRPENSRAVRQFAARLKQHLKPRTMRVGFLEEAPYLADIARDLGAALCLPFFAAEAGHVIRDVPAALAAAGFAGPVLPPLIHLRGVEGLVASALARACPARRGA